MREVVTDVFTNLIKVLTIFTPSLNSGISNNVCEVFVRESIQMWTTSALRDPSAEKTYLHILNGCKKALKMKPPSLIANVPDHQSEDDRSLDCAKDIICSALESINDQMMQASVCQDVCSKDIDIDLLYEAYLDTLAEMPTSKLDKMIK